MNSEGLVQGTAWVVPVFGTREAGSRTAVEEPELHGPTYGVSVKPSLEREGCAWAGSSKGRP